MNFKKNTKPKQSEKERGTLESLYALFEGREKVFNVFKNRVFPLPPINSN